MILVINYVCAMYHRKLGRKGLNAKKKENTLCSHLLFGGKLGLFSDHISLDSYLTKSSNGF